MKKIIICLFVFMCTGLVPAAACPSAEEGSDETFHHLRVIPLHSNGIISVAVQGEREMKMIHEVKENDIYIEVIIDDFSFSKENSGKAHVSGEGHLQLYLNGTLIDSIYRSGFIIKGLPQGEHTIKVEVAQNDGKPYGLVDEFSVTVTE
ncbi:hypothetical protein [Bacillus alkalicellulosilyticus]|uniref:hypothetical protein n=1 Tax=Alkalihalobacterium alkalicellulosilyticum TaxID=1912214 RepID=UPI0009985004|nr:hypothetical protein [Bacillus alkalicellulosilyticus]